MKKILCILFFLVLVFPQIVLCSPTTSENAFEIVIDDAPLGGGGSKKSNGLSDGAVTAIALGSVFGGLGALGGLYWYFAHHNSGLTSGAACGCESPYSTICVENDSSLEKLKNNPNENKHIIKAFQYIKPGSCSNKKFLIIPDTYIENKTYNTVFFEFPEFDGVKNLNVRIIQVSDPYSISHKLPSLDTKMLLNPKDKNVQEIPTTVVKNDYQNGVLIKQGQIKEFKNNIAAISTQYDSSSKVKDKKRYALIVEFSR